MSVHINIFNENKACVSHIQDKVVWNVRQIVRKWSTCILWRIYEHTPILQNKNKSVASFEVTSEILQKLGSSYWEVFFEKCNSKLFITWEIITYFDCLKSVQIRSNFWSVFSPNVGKYGPKITPYLDIFHAVFVIITYKLTNFSRYLKNNRAIIHF